MEISATGVATAREYTLTRNQTEQQLLQKTAEKDEDLQKTPQALEPRPAERAGADKQGRIDIYA